MPTRSECAARDAADRLAPMRDRFRLPDGVIYLDGNSLGPLTHGAAERLRTAAEVEWGEGLIRSWSDAGWVDLPRRVGDRIARLVGAAGGTVVAGDSTSVNLFKAVEAARRLRPARRYIVSDTANFPTDLYVMEGIAEAAGLELELVEPHEVINAICDDTALVALTEVDYRTGRRYDMAQITAATHAAGAVSVWDLAHSVGAFPVALADCDVDFAVGCGYKYLNGGPGAPAFMYVAPRHHRAWSNPIAGWFGHARPFQFEIGFDPALDMARAMVGTPPVLSMVALDAALDVFDDVDLADVRAKSVALTELFMELADERLAGLAVVTPRIPDERGSQVALCHPHGFRIIQALTAKGIIGDFRSPDVLRFGFAPLYLRFVDVFDAVQGLVAVMESEEWRHERFAPRP